MQTPTEISSSIPSSTPSSMRRRRGLRRRAFTLVETLLAVSLLSLLFLGAVNLYLTALQAGVKSGAQLTASATAANGLHHVEQDVREAYFFVLPSTAPAPSPAFGADLGPGYPVSSFQTSYFDPSVGASRTINTGLKLTFPAAKTATVYKTDGSTASPARYDTQTAGASLYIYRADLPPAGSNSPAVPDPAQGDCLWASGTENGTAINQSFARLSDSRSAAGGVSAANSLPNSVEFLKPPAPNSLEIRLISSYYSPISNSSSTVASQQGSESSRVLLTGKCVFMQDHQQAGN